MVPRLLRVIDDLTNWYIRFNRKRLKGVAGLGVADTNAALNTLLLVLFTIVRALAPFTPFITEHIYGLLKPHLGDWLSNLKDTRSVHFLPFPTVQREFFDAVIERKVTLMQRVIQLGRTARERRSISLKTPLLTLVVIADSHHLSDLESLESYIQEELNVRHIDLTTDESRHGILLEAKVDWPTLGKKLKKQVQVVRKALPGLDQEQLRAYQRDKRMVIEGIELDENDLSIVRTMRMESSVDDIGGGHGPQWEPAFDEDVVILLDAAPHPELMEEGLARDVINRVQRLRKKAGLVPTDDVCMQYAVLSNPDGIKMAPLVSEREELFQASLRGKLEEVGSLGEGVSENGFIMQEEHVLGNLVLMLRLMKL